MGSGAVGPSGSRAEPWPFSRSVKTCGGWYNCSPSFNWKKKLPADKIADFQRAIGAMAGSTETEQFH